MGVIGFLCVSLGSSIVQLHDSLGSNVHAYVQRLISVVRMATMLEEYTVKEQCSVVRFCEQKDSMQRIFIKKCFLFVVRSICPIKLVTTGLRNSLKDVRKSQMIHDQVALLRL
jgi:hypothetical protein